MLKIFKFLNVLITFILLVSSAKADFEIKAKTVILQDFLSGKILYEKEPDLPFFQLQWQK